MASDTRLTVKVGHSTQKKSAEAAREALRSLAGHEDGYQLVLVYCGVKHKQAVILEEVRRQLGDVEVAGCTTTGELCSAGLIQEGLVIAGLSSSLLEAGVGYGTDVFKRPADAARDAIEMARGKLGGADGRKNHLCILHTAGFTLDKAGVEEDVLAATKAALGEGWLVVGGSASDGARFLGSRELAAGRVLEESVVVTLIATDLDVHHAMEHGFVPANRSFPITEVDGTLVKKIDGKLAVDFYADLLGVKRKQLTKGLGLIRMTDKVPKFLSAMTQKVGLTPQAITDKIPFFTYSNQSPFGVKSEGGAYVVKVPKVITSEGWLEFQTRMDDVGELQLMKVDDARSMSASARAVSTVDGAGAEAGHPPALVLVYECLGRYMYLLKTIDQLFPKVRAATGAEIVGFFSAAEQGEMEGLACQAHNYSTSVLGLG